MSIRSRLLLGSLALTMVGCQTLPATTAGPGGEDWAYFGGDLGSTQYSALDEVNRANVAQLEIAWTYETGPEMATASPLIAGGMMYLIINNKTIVAVDPATGREIWKAVDVTDRQRGLSYWRSADGRESRLLFCKDQKLRAIDARTGQPITDFGADGGVDLRVGLGRDPEKVPSIQPVTPGKIVGDIIVLGANTGETYEAAPGDIRGIDVRTGKVVWQFHTIPHPGEAGYETWADPDAWKKHGGANSWGGMAIDGQRGIAYLGTGSATYDFFGGDRKGANLFADSLLAIDVKTGKLVWYFQTVHHDLWDYDLTSSPVLMDLRKDGKTIPVVVQATKTGMVYVFDRRDGKPVYPIEERPVPASTVEGEHAWPTQPHSTLPPFARQTFTADDLDPLIPEAERRALATQIAAARNEGLFTPPSLGDTIQMPGNQGGVNWGMTAGEPKSGRFYVASFDAPAILRLEKMQAAPLGLFATTADRGRAVYSGNCAMCHGAELQGQGAVPALKGAVARLGLDETVKIVRNGRNQMPAFGASLSKVDIEAVTAYLADPSAPPALPVDPSKGSAAAAARSGAPVVAPQKQADHGLSGGAEAPAAPSEPVGESRYFSGYGIALTKNFKTIIKPPWSSITAYDLNTGKILWQRPNGGFTGYPVAEVGTPLSKGGLVVTAGGLLFAPSAGDRKLNAFDKDTGKLLWQGALPSVPQGVPAIYAAGGRQFIAVPVSSYISVNSPIEEAGRPPGKNSYVVFALPKRR